jgi:hypothetical protein
VSTFINVPIRTLTALDRAGMLLADATEHTWFS